MLQEPEANKPFQAPLLRGCKCDQSKHASPDKYILKRLKCICKNFGCYDEFILIKKVLF
jgi:hypothetical protein